MKRPIMKRPIMKSLINENWHCPLIAELDDMVNCASCGKVVRYGETHTSRKVMTPGGLFGFPVCEECYQKEREEENNDKE